MREGLAQLKAREEEIGREWQWLQDVLNHVAHARAEQIDATAFRLLQRQAVAVGQRRVELMMQMAALEKP